MEWLSRLLGWFLAKRSERTEDREGFQAITLEWQRLYDALKARIVAVELEARECEEARKVDHARILQLEARIAELERTR